MSLKTKQIQATNRAIVHEDRFVRSIVSNYREALRAIRTELAALYDKYAVNGELTLAQMTKYNRLSKMDAQITELLGPYIRSADVTIQRLTPAQYEEAFYRKAWSFDTELRTSLGWGQIPADQVKAAVANPLEKIARLQHKQHTLSRVRRAISQGLIRGASMPSMMRDVRTAMGTTTADAMRIVRTEAHRARELGNLAAAQRAEEKGVELVRVWDATLDNRTRPTHAALDGAETTVDEPFDGGPMYPGGWGDAGEDINCRCTVTEVIKGYEPEGRRVGGKVAPNTTFKQWAKEHGITGNRYGQAYNFL